MTANMNTASGREPSDIELLLPWYAAGTLDRRESQQVETALANDPELARRYEWVRAEFAQETSINEAAGEPSDQDVKSLFARIDALPVRRPRVSARSSVNLGDRIAAFFGALSPRTLAWSAMAAALAIVLQAGVLAGIAFKERSPGGYETASAPANVAAGGAEVLIRFQPQATAAAIATFLDANKLSIVGGPSGGELFRVRVASTKLAKADLMRIVKTLQDDKIVGFIAMTD
jgi:anti-sigma factor RsiW